jgi:hypothetical protein
MVLIFDYSPRIGKTNVFVYVSVCSLVGSISVIGVKVRRLVAVPCSRSVDPCA